MTEHTIGTRDEWAAARAALLAREKEHTRMGDELARLRRELPWVRVEKPYTLQTEEGPKTLAELFEGRSQLVVYHFMFGLDYDAGCLACSATADSFNGVLAHFSARDVTLICVSRAPLEKLLAYRERMGWRFPWASSHDSDFNLDFGVSAGEGLPHEAAAGALEANELAALRRLHAQPDLRGHLPLATTRNASASGTDVDGYLSEGHGVSTFAREGDTVYHCYSSYARNGVPDGLLRDPGPRAQGPRRRRSAHGLAAPPRRLRPPVRRGRGEDVPPTVATVATADGGRWWRPVPARPAVIEGHRCGHQRIPRQREPRRRHAGGYAPAALLL